MIPQRETLISNKTIKTNNLKNPVLPMKLEPICSIFNILAQLAVQIKICNGFQIF